MCAKLDFRGDSILLIRGGQSGFRNFKCNRIINHSNSGHRPSRRPSPPGEYDGVVVLRCPLWRSVQPTGSQTGMGMSTPLPSGPMICRRRRGG